MDALSNYSTDLHSVQLTDDKCYELGSVPTNPKDIQKLGALHNDCRA